MWASGSRLRETKSSRPSTAQPRKPKPWPRLAMVAGAKALTEAKRASGSVLVSRYLEGRTRLHLNRRFGLEGPVNGGTVSGLNGPW